MFVKMLIENNCKDTDLKKEHGLSLFIDALGEKILFDTGASGEFVDNAAKMGVNIEEIDKVVISHAHKDHTGGLLRFLEKNNKATIYISEKATQDYYYNALIIKEDISFPKKIFEKYPERIRFVNSYLEISEKIFLIPNFKKSYPLVKSSKYLLVKRDGKYIMDDFDHEQALVIDNGGKLVIITGCSHNGVDNMVETIMTHFPNTPVQTVIGGFHLMGFSLPNLMGESKSYINALAKRLIGYDIEKVYTCHCTGKRGYKILKETMEDKIDYFYTGMQIEL